MENRATKQQIVIDLAETLEGKFRIDRISIEIVNRLQDKVSEVYILECLDEKYKQKIHVDNAKKQKHKEKELELAMLP